MCVFQTQSCMVFLLYTSSLLTDVSMLVSTFTFLRVFDEPMLHMGLFLWQQHISVGWSYSIVQHGIDRHMSEMQCFFFRRLHMVSLSSQSASRFNTLPETSFSSLWLQRVMTWTIKARQVNLLWLLLKGSVLVFCIYWLIPSANHEAAEQCVIILTEEYMTYT